MVLETDLIGEHLKNLSIDSNETIKNTDVHDPRADDDDDDDSEALDEDENDEWNEFLDLQLKECLQELEEQKTCNSIHKSNFLLMVLPLLKSPISGAFFSSINQEFNTVIHDARFTIRTILTLFNQ